MTYEDIELSLIGLEGDDDLGDKDLDEETEEEPGEETPGEILPDEGGDDVETTGIEE